MAYVEIKVAKAHPNKARSGLWHAHLEQREHRVLRPHELRAILEATDGEDRAFFATLIFAGLRRAEAYGMRWDWLNFEEDMLHVKVAKRGSSKIPLAPYLKRALSALGAGLTGPGFVGRYRSNADQAQAAEPKEVTDKRRSMARTLAAAGVDPKAVGFHTFRRLFITLIERLPGAFYSLVRALARHGVSTTDVTARYLHPAQEDLGRALAQFEQAIMDTANVVPLRQTGT